MGIDGILKRFFKSLIGIDANENDNPNMGLNDNPNIRLNDNNSTENTPEPYELGYVVSSTQEALTIDEIATRFLTKLDKFGIQLGFDPIQNLIDSLDECINLTSSIYGPTMQLGYTLNNTENISSIDQINLNDISKNFLTFLTYSERLQNNLGDNPKRFIIENPSVIRLEKDNKMYNVTIIEPYARIIEPMMEIWGSLICSFGNAKKILENYVILNKQHLPNITSISKDHKIRGSFIFPDLQKALYHWRIEDAKIPRLSNDYSLMLNSTQKPAYENLYQLYQTILKTDETMKILSNQELSTALAQKSKIYTSIAQLITHYKSENDPNLGGLSGLRKDLQNMLEIAPTIENRLRDNPILEEIYEFGRSTGFLMYKSFDLLKDYSKSKKII